MTFNLIFTEQASDDLDELEGTSGKEKTLKAVRKALGYLETNPRHPGLQTHEYTLLSQKFGFKVLEAYAENHTPQAYRIFWHYGRGKKEITIIAITPHP